MTLSPRQQRIIDKLHDTNGVLSSLEITSLFNVSVQTIRKDLNELSELGHVRRAEVWYQYQEKQYCPPAIALQPYGQYFALLRGS